MKHIKDENGAYMDCYAYPGRGKSSCRVLKVRYNPTANKYCAGCPFFKTRKQAVEDAKKYPPQEEYKEKKERQNVIRKEER